MFKEIIVVLTEPVCDCKDEGQLQCSINIPSGDGLILWCARCKKQVRAPSSYINKHVRLRILRVIEGGAKIVSLEESKKEKGDTGIVD